MLQLLNRKFVITLMVIVSVLQLFFVQYLSYVFNQQYILLQYQTIYENIDEIGDEPGVYSITGTEFVVGVDWSEDIENGIVLNDDHLIIYLNSIGQTYDYEEYDVETAEDIYNNILIYKYSTYVTPYVMVMFGVDAMINYVVVILLLYLVCKIHEHNEYKKGYATSSFSIKRTSKIKMCINSAFVGILIYSFTSLVIPAEHLIIVLASVIAILVHIKQLTNIRRIKL